MSNVAASQMACHECDLLIEVPALAVKEKAFCPRCDYLLAANRPRAQEAIFAYSISALMFLVLANAFPFLGFSASGQERVVSLLQSVAVLITEKIPSLAAVVFASIILIPALFLMAMIYISLAILRGKTLPGASIVLRSAMSLLPWSMSEIFLIGILVSFVKISSIADVSLGLSFWSYVLFTLCMSAAVMHIDKREIWQRVRELQHD